MPLEAVVVIMIIIINMILVMITIMIGAVPPPRSPRRRPSLAFAAAVAAIAIRGGSGRHSCAYGPMRKKGLYAQLSCPSVVSIQADLQSQA